MQTVITLFKRLFKYYQVDILLAVVFLFIAFLFVYDQSVLLSAIARKIGLASAGLVCYYITRYIKIGIIEWRDPFDKLYSLFLLLYIGLVFAFG